MRKALTEQWRDGTLPDGNYYFKLKDGTILSGCQAITDGVFRCEYMDFHKRVKEVLVPVPSFEQYQGLMNDSKELDKAYDKINLLEKKLEIATKVLEHCQGFDSVSRDLKEMGDVK